MNYMLDKDFLKQLDEDNLKQCYVKIEVLDSEEKPISDIVGRVSTGNININGSSPLSFATFKIQSTSLYSIGATKAITP